MLNLFESQDVNTAISRINNLTPETKGAWGKMTVDQMLAHLNVAYEMAYTDKHPKPGAFAKFFIKLFVKSTVVGSKPYAKNGQTAPAFKITGPKDFKVEKQRLIEYLKKTQELGPAHYDGKESNSLGALTTQEWNTLYSKHLEHHLTQFGV